MVTWGGASTLLASDGSTTLAEASPRGPWSVEIASPADGPWLLLRRVVAGTAGDPGCVHGAPDPGGAWRR